MTVETISWSISMKVWDETWIELATPGFAVRHASATDTLPTALRGPVFALTVKVSCAIWFSEREENDHKNYFMINLYESMGPGLDITGNPWLCSQTRICRQTHYRLSYVAWSVHLLSKYHELSLILKQLQALPMYLDRSLLASCTSISSIFLFIHKQCWSGFSTLTIPFRISVSVTKHIENRIHIYITFGTLLF